MGSNRTNKMKKKKRNATNTTGAPQFQPPQFRPPLFIREVEVAGATSCSKEVEVASATPDQSIYTQVTGNWGATTPEPTPDPPLFIHEVEVASATSCSKEVEVVSATPDQLIYTQVTGNRDATTPEPTPDHQSIYTQIIGNWECTASPSLCLDCGAINQEVFAKSGLFTKPAMGKKRGICKGCIQLKKETRKAQQVLLEAAPKTCPDCGAIKPEVFSESGFFSYTQWNKLGGICKECVQLKQERSLFCPCCHMPEGSQCLKRFAALPVTPNKEKYSKYVSACDRSLWQVRPSLDRLATSAGGHVAQKTCLVTGIVSLWFVLKDSARTISIDEANTLAQMGILLHARGRVCASGNINRLERSERHAATSAMTDRENKRRVKLGKQRLHKARSSHPRNKR
jgi:hypothetical protein